MQDDSEIKGVLLEVSELERDQQPALYMSYYNTMKGGQKVSDEVSRWIPENSDVKKQTKGHLTVRNNHLRLTEAAFLPRLEKNESQERLPQTDRPSVEVARYMRSSSIGIIIEQARRRSQMIVNMSPRTKVSTILLGLSLPKVSGKGEKFNKYQMMSISVENNLKRTKNRKTNKKSEQKLEIAQELGQRAQDSQNSRGNLLNDQLSSYFSKVMDTNSSPSGIDFKKHCSKIPCIKYGLRRRQHTKHELIESYYPSLQVRNGILTRPL